MQYFVIGIFFLCCNNKGTLLKFDLSQQIGDSFTYSFVHSARSKIDSHESVDTSFADIKLKVLAHNGQQNRVELTFLNLVHRRQKLNMTPTNSFSIYNRAYDSVLMKTKGKTLEIFINEKGEVDTVRGYDEIVSSIASELSMDKRSIYQELNDYASAQAIQDNLNRLFAFFPNKSVTTGDDWGNTIIMVTKAPINFNSLYTLKKISGDSLYVEIESNILGGTSNYQLSGTQSGSVVLDKNSHVPFLYTSNSSSTTKTVAYEVHEWDHWLIKLKNHQKK